MPALSNATELSPVKEVLTAQTVGPDPIRAEKSEIWRPESFATRPAACMYLYTYSGPGQRDNIPLPR